MLRRPIQVVLSGFRRVQCVNTTVGKVRHCNDNCVNLNNMTHTQARHTRALGSNMRRDVNVSRNGANHNNLINVQSNKWDLPTIINTNIRGALASKIDEIKVIKDNYGVDVLAVTETWCTSRIPDGCSRYPVSTSTRGTDKMAVNMGGLFAMYEIQSRLSNAHS